jgi:hypothetical protein
MILIINTCAPSAYTNTGKQKEVDRMHRIIVSLTISAIMMATVVVAIAQHQQPKHHGGQAPVGFDVSQGPFAVRVFGAFRDMMQKKDHGSKVELGAILVSPDTEAVGALSELRGEITITSGKPLVSYGSNCSDCPPPHGEKATLLITSRVSSWLAPIPLPESLAGHELDRFIVQQAKGAGLDTSKPFPVRMTGTLTNVAMHVIKASNPQFGGHGSGQPMALQEDIKASSIEGHVVGFYAPEHLIGVITHPGEPFHYHWVDADRTRTAHLDAFGMVKGAMLLLPKQ